MLSRLSIRAKLIPLVSLLLVALAFMGGFAILEMRAINAAAQDIQTNWLPSIRLVGELRTQSARYRAVLRGYLTSLTRKSWPTSRTIWTHALKITRPPRRPIRPSAPHPMKSLFKSNWRKAGNPSAARPMT